MGLLGTLATEIAAWLGFVGACVVAPVAACRPFLAFVALTLSATVCLLLTTAAMRAIWQRARHAPEARSQQHVTTALAHDRIEPVLSPAEHEAGARADDRWGMAA